MNIKDSYKLFREIDNGDINYLKEYHLKGGDMLVVHPYHTNECIGHRSALNGHVECLKYWFDHGGDPYFIDRYKNTIGHYASFKGNLSCLKLWHVSCLCKDRSRFDMDFLNDCGHTIGYVAQWNKNYKRISKRYIECLNYYNQYSNKNDK